MYLLDVEEYMQVMNGYVIDGEQSKTNEFLRELCDKTGEPYSKSTKIKDVADTIDMLLKKIGSPDNADIGMLVIKELLEDQKEQAAFHLGRRIH